MASITFKGISKSYEDVNIIKSLDLDIKDEEFMVLVGPSGCGKSTTLRIIAGLEDITSGELFIGDKLVNKLHPKDRDVAMVFQSYALYPHMTVRENIIFGLKIRKFPKEHIEEMANEAAEILGLTHLLDRKPKALSGGQRQRVALGRAIVRHPSVFLFDEPLSNLDAELRVQMRAEISKLQKRLKTTAIYVTHDQVEAMTMGDRIAVMKNGVLMQVGTPMELYTKPANLFVASFIGTPTMTFIPVTINKDSQTLKNDVFSTPIPDDIKMNVLRHAQNHSDKLIMGIRPENMRLHTQTSETSNMNLSIEAVETLGHEVILHGTVGDHKVVAKSALEQTPKMGETIPMDLDLSAIHLFDAKTEVRINN
ncbi:MAG: sn-glycerol-3-phosphate ABC transporter ATP-binding protein UgpC [Pseudomonadota bacterium]